MASAADIDNQWIAKILESNNNIKKSTYKIVQDYVELQKHFFDQVGTIIAQLDSVKCVADVFLNEEQHKLLKDFQPIERVQLAICGYNSTGKTTFVHEILGYGSFLPTGLGAVSARIIKFSYAPAAEACLVQYTSECDPDMPEERVDLSSCSEPPINKHKLKTLRDVVKQYVARPLDVDAMSDEFEKWASHLVELRIPSSFLKLGIDIYDTPGFLGSDPPVLVKNLLKLVDSVHPSLVYLYDNPVVSDDSRQCFAQLQLAFRDRIHGTGIFFLNTKADVLVIRKDAENASEDEVESENEGENTTTDRLLNRAREERYNLLLEAKELSNIIPEEKRLPFDRCDCFDIFSSLSPTDSAEKTMKQHAINSIIHFAAEYDLRSTKQVISTILGAIDDFFDFVLITNRRSKENWDEMRIYAFQWIDQYFATYQSEIDSIATEAKKRLPIKFNQCRPDIEKRAIPHCETTWWERIYATGLRADPFNLGSSSAVIEYINMTVENEVIKPVLSEITSNISKHTKEKVDQTNVTSRTNKNELVVAAYRAVMQGNKEYGSFYSRSSFNFGAKIALTILSPIIAINALSNTMVRKLTFGIIREGSNDVDTKIKVIEMKRKAALREHLEDLEESIRDMDEKIKDNMQKWLESSKEKFHEKVNGYYHVAIRTLDKRKEAYDLAREFAPRFARVECCLVANLDLAQHHGLPLTIQQNSTLGTGGFFTVHPAQWDQEQNLVVKLLKDPIRNQDIACIEAHFHRTVTRLHVPHMVPLSYLYETDSNPKQFAIVLPRYPKNLRSYLEQHISTITIDKAAQISLDISRAIAHMHDYELVHRDVKVRNILLDENDQVFLADFGTCQHGTENATFIGTYPLVPELSSADRQHSYQGAAFDVFCLGILMYVVAPKDVFHEPRTLTDVDVASLDPNRVPKRYCKWILRCIDTDPTERPGANEIVQALEKIIDEISNTKPCLICLDAPRYARCLPCRHKTMCSDCLNKVRASQTPRCIFCYEVFTDIELDADPNTFLRASVPTTTA